MGYLDEVAKEEYEEREYLKGALKRVRKTENGNMGAKALTEALSEFMPRSTEEEDDPLYESPEEAMHSKLGEMMRLAEAEIILRVFEVKFPGLASIVDRKRRMVMGYLPIELRGFYSAWMDAVVWMRTTLREIEPRGTKVSVYEPTKPGELRRKIEGWDYSFTLGLPSPLIKRDGDRGGDEAYEDGSGEEIFMQAVGESLRK